MRGSIRFQVNELFHKGGVYQVGNSRHQSKVQAKESLPKGKKTAQNISRQTGIHSVKYTDHTKQSWVRFGEFVKSEFGLKDLSKVESKHIQAYMERQIDKCSTYKSWSVEASRISKLENAIKSLQGKEQDLRNAIEKTRDVAKTELGNSKRISGFKNPENVISMINNNDHKLAARLQYEGGCRRCEVQTIKQSQLKGIREDPVTGKRQGVVELENTKGGKDRDAFVSEQTYKELESRTASNTFRISESHYNQSVNSAAKSCDERFTGTHSFRYNWTAERYNECISHGMSDQDALKNTSVEMGHNRASMTLHYLR